MRSELTTPWWRSARRAGGFASWLHGSCTCCKGHIYIFHSSNNGLEGTVEKRSVKDGSLVWGVDLDTEVGFAVNGFADTWMHGAADDSAIYFTVITTPPTKFYAVRMNQEDGSVPWIVLTGSHRNCAVFTDGDILVGARKLDAATGETIWISNFSQSIESDCDADGNAFFGGVLGNAEKMVSLDSSGLLRWSTPWPITPPAIQAGIAGVGVADQGGAWFSATVVRPLRNQEEHNLVDAGGTVIPFTKRSLAFVGGGQSIVRNNANTLFIYASFHTSVPGTTHHRAEVMDGFGNPIVSAWEVDQYGGTLPPSRAYMWRPLWSANRGFFVPYQLADASWVVRNLTGTGWDDLTTPQWEVTYPATVDKLALLAIDFDLPSGGRS